MSTRDELRHSRAEIRAFAKWLKDGGWTYQYTDSSGHTIWAHPKASGTYKLPETPARFGVQRARQDVMRLLGQKPAGKRKGKKVTAVPRRDFALQQAQKQAMPAPVVRRVASPQRVPITAAERQAERDFTFFDSLMRRAPGGR